MALDTWIDATSLWNNAANWSNGVPKSGDDVVINTGGADTITYADTPSVTLSSLVLGASDTLSIERTPLGVSGMATVDGSLNQIGGGLLGGTWIFSGSSNNWGSNAVDDSTALIVASSGVITVGSRWTLGAGGTLQNNGTFHQAGNISLGDIRGTGTLTNGAQGVYDIDFTVMSSLSIINGFKGTPAPSFTNAGTLNLNGAGDNFAYVNTNFASTGLIDVTASTLSLQGARNTLSGTVTGMDASASDTLSHLRLYHATRLDGLALTGDLTVHNYGTVTQGAGNVTFGDSASSRVFFLNDTAAIYNLTGDGDINAGSAGALQFTDTGIIEKTGGQGTSLINVAVSALSTGSIKVSSGTLAFEQNVTGRASMLIDGGELRFDANTTNGGATLNFAGSSGTLSLANPNTFKASINGFQTGDDIHLLTTMATQAIYDGGTDKLVLKNGAATVASLKVVASAATTSANFHLASDGMGGTHITFV